MYSNFFCYPIVDQWEAGRWAYGIPPIGELNQPLGLTNYIAENANLVNAWSTIASKYPLFSGCFPVYPKFKKLL